MVEDILAWVAIIFGMFIEHVMSIWCPLPNFLLRSWQWQDAMPSIEASNYISTDGPTPYNISTCYVNVVAASEFPSKIRQWRDDQSYKHHIIPTTLYHKTNRQQQQKRKDFHSNTIHIIYLSWN